MADEDVQYELAKKPQPKTDCVSATITTTAPVMADGGQVERDCSEVRPEATAEATPAVTTTCSDGGGGDDNNDNDDSSNNEERRLADKEFARKDEASASDGLREGLADGKEKALQQGFDSGFKQGFQLVENISIWRGFVQGLSTSIKKLDSGQEEKKQLYALYGKLLEFEQKVINSEAPLEEIRGQMEEVKKDIGTVLHTLGMAHLLDTMTDL